MTTLLDSSSECMVLTFKKLLYKKLDHETINELKYTISAQRVVVAYNTTHLLVWSINHVLFQI
jgi:hypothetical protein